MKRTVYFLAFVLLGFTGCKKDEPVAPSLSAASIQGTWKITAAEGTEWKKGTGIITPRAADSGTLNLVLTISATTISVNTGSGTVTFPYTLDVSGSTIIGLPDGNTGLGLFAISAFTGSTMNWDQREPIDADYALKSGPNSCGCYLYFQKFWTLTKQ